LGPRLYKEDGSVRKCPIGTPNLPNFMSQNGFEERCNHIPTRPVTVVVISRAHQEIVNCCRLIAREFLSAVVSSTKVPKCWVEQSNVETTILGRTAIVKGEFLLLFRDCTYFRCGRGGGCLEPEAYGSPMG